MARLVLSETDGSPSQELQSLTAGVWLDVFEGDVFGLADARGSNVVIPGKPGEVVFAHVEDSLAVKLGGPVWGVGATAALRRAAYRTRLMAIRTILGNVGKVVRLVAHPPNMALTGAETATIDAQVMRLVLPPPQGWEVESRIEIHLRCVSDPPDWTIA